tara:strand:- start:66 stop:269 length:204 start_codon:yes stop_codon:yes gene_type:complete
LVSNPSGLEGCLADGLKFSSNVSLPTLALLLESNFAFPEFFPAFYSLFKFEFEFFSIVASVFLLSTL